MITSEVGMVAPRWSPEQRRGCGTWRRGLGLGVWKIEGCRDALAPVRTLLLLACCSISTRDR